MPHNSSDIQVCLLQITSLYNYQPRGTAFYTRFFSVEWTQNAVYVLLHWRGMTCIFCVGKLT